MVVPRAEVELRGNWDVMGLRATSSYDYRIDTDVPAHASFEFFSPTRYRGGPMYDLGVIIALVEIGPHRLDHRAWSGGPWTRPSPSPRDGPEWPRRRSSPRIPRFRYDFAMAVSRFQAAETWCRQAFRTAEQAAEAGTGTRSRRWQPTSSSRPRC